MTGYNVQSCRTCSCDKAPSADAVAAAPVSSHSFVSSPRSLGNGHTYNIDVGTAGNLDQPGASGADSPAAVEPAPVSASRTVESYAASQTAEPHARTAASSAAAPAPASAESYDIQQGDSLGDERLSFDPPALTAPPPQPALPSGPLSDSGSAAGIGSQSSALGMMAGRVSSKVQRRHVSVVSSASPRDKSYGI